MKIAAIFLASVAIAHADDHRIHPTCDDTKTPRCWVEHPESATPANHPALAPVEQRPKAAIPSPAQAVQQPQPPVYAQPAPIYAQPAPIYAQPAPPPAYGYPPPIYAPERRQHLMLRFGPFFIDIGP